MKTTTYRNVDGTEYVLEYDADAPCVVCQLPVVSASAGGTVICPWCDMGRCRYCGVSCGLMLKAELDGGRSVRMWRRHVADCHRKSVILGPAG